MPTLNWNQTYMLGDPSLHTSNKNDGKSLTHALHTLKLGHAFTEKKLKHELFKQLLNFLGSLSLKLLWDYTKFGVPTQGCKAVCKGHGWENSPSSWFKLKMQDLYHNQFCLTKKIKNLKSTVCPYIPSFFVNHCHALSIFKALQILTVEEQNK